jgi:anti-sigma-K factor RskA
MSRQSEEEVLLRNYLLGDLDAAAREEVEERMLGDDDFAARVSAAQDALIDDYVFETLPPRERESFDRNFVIDEKRRLKLLFARALKIYVDERDGPPGARRAPRPTSPLWQKPRKFIRAHQTGVAVSAAVVLLLLLLAPAILRRFQTPDPDALLREQRAAVGRHVAEFNKRPAGPNVEAAPSFELALVPAFRREDNVMPTAVLGDNVRLLALKLPLSGERHENYSAVVLTVAGAELFTVHGLTPQSVAGAWTVPLNIPRDVLRTDDYQIRLLTDGGSKEAGRYNFRVIFQK